MHWTQDPKNKGKLRRAHAKKSRTQKTKREGAPRQSRGGRALNGQTAAVTSDLTTIVLKCDRKQQQALEPLLRCMNVTHAIVKV